MSINGLFGNIVNKWMTKKLQNSTIREEDVAELLRQIKIALLDSDVNIKVTKEFVKNVKEKIVGQIVGPGEKPSDFVLQVIKEELVNILGKNKQEINTNKKQVRIMMVGLQGSGKTTTTAKIANYFKTKYNKKPLLIAADIYRPAAIDQLQTLAQEINVDFFQQGTIAADVIVKEGLEYADRHDDDFVIVDTAGRLQTNKELMEELVEVKKALNPDEILLVVDAMAGQNIVEVAEEFNRYLKLTGLVFTKLDSDARAGAILSLTSIINVPIKFTGVGERIGSLDVFYPERMAERILGLGDIVSLAEKASDIYDEKQAKNAMQRMLSGKMDLEDLLRQMEQINKMGSIGGIMKMLPGMASQKINENKLAEAEERMKIWRIMLSSMTLKERRNPKLFKKQPSRKLRVVKGSGRKMDELNKLLKQWEEARDKMAQAGKMMLMGKNPFSGGFKGF